MGETQNGVNGCAEHSEHDRHTGNGTHNQTGSSDLGKPASELRPRIDVRGGPPKGTFSWGALSCRLIVGLVWGITPICWIYLSDTLYCLIRGHREWSHGLPLPIHGVLLAYSTLEAAFSIYYRYLVSLCQEKVVLPNYGRPFLRQTLARALEDGMKLEDPETILRNPQTTPTKGSAEGRPRRPTYSRANFSQLSFLDKSKPLDVDDPRAVEWREMFKNWFLGEPWEQLKRDNVLEWLAWSFYSMSYEEAVQEWLDEGEPPLPLTLQDADEIMNETSEDENAGGKLAFLYHGLYMLEARSGMPLPDGRTPGVRSIRLHLDPVRVTSRPLAKYLVTAFFNVLLERRAARAGFKRVKHDGLEYLIRIPHGWRSGDDATQPTMFIHGLGMGLAQYASLVSYFEQHPRLKERPLILLIQPHLSMALFHPHHLRPPTKESTNAGLRALVKKWGFEDGITVISHSNGTIVAGWLLKECPELVKRSCLVDPVTFCLWEPQVAYNFLYRKPQSGIEILMRYFVGEEIGIALMLQRHFDWSANILWFEEIPEPLDNYRTAFFLAEKDSILDAKRTARYLRDHGVKRVEERGNLRYLHGLAHGEALITGGKPLREVMDWITQSPPDKST